MTSLLRIPGHLVTQPHHISASIRTTSWSKILLILITRILYSLYLSHVAHSSPSLLLPHYFPIICSRLLYCQSHPFLSSLYVKTIRFLPFLYSFHTRTFYLLTPSFVLLSQPIYFFFLPLLKLKSFRSTDNAIC